MNDLPGQVWVVIRDSDQEPDVSINRVEVFGAWYLLSEAMIAVFNNHDVEHWLTDVKIIPLHELAFRIEIDGRIYVIEAVDMS